MNTRDIIGISAAVIFAVSTVFSACKVAEIARSIEGIELRQREDVLELKATGDVLANKLYSVARDVSRIHSDMYTLHAQTNTEN